MSGGMRQRVMIAIALSCNPDLLIADEPTTALDVTIQARILDLLKELRVARNMAILLITHNMGLVAEMCDRVAVMHGGKIVEMARVEDMFDTPRHPYTRGLLRSIPTLDSIPKQRLATLDWHPTEEQLKSTQLVEAAPGHWVSAWAA
jgi:ABC-type dipeptide/oligopeptide/nickel transport system ATPase component